MNYTESFKGIKMDVQSGHIIISYKLQKSINKMIDKLRRHFRGLNWVDIYLKKKNGHSTAHRTISVRLGIPGNDVFASESGDNCIALLKNVERKLCRQLEKR